MQQTMRGLFPKRSGFIGLFGVLVLLGGLCLPAARAGLDAGPILRQSSFPAPVKIVAVGKVTPEPGYPNGFRITTAGGETYRFSHRATSPKDPFEAARQGTMVITGSMPKGDPAKGWLTMKDFRPATAQEQEPPVFVPSQQPARLVTAKDSRWTIDGVRWGPKGRAGSEPSLDPYLFARTTIDGTKLSGVYLGIQTVPPVLRHVFLMFTFAPGGFVTAGKESPGLVVSVEPLRYRTTGTKPLAEMLSGQLPIVYQLGAWEDFTVYNCERWRQSLTLWKMQLPFGRVSARQLLDGLLREAVRPRLSERYDMNSNNCSSSVMAALYELSDRDSAVRIRREFSGPLIITNPRRIPGVWEALGLICEADGVTITPKNHFVPLPNLLKK